MTQNLLSLSFSLSLYFSLFVCEMNLTVIENIFFHANTNELYKKIICLQSNKFIINYTNKNNCVCVLY